MVGLTLRKDRASRPAFLGAEASEAEVRMLLLVPMGDILSPGGSEGGCRLVRLGGRRTLEELWAYPRPCDETFAAPEPADFR